MNHVKLAEKKSVDISTQTPRPGGLPSASQPTLEAIIRATARVTAEEVLRSKAKKDYKTRTFLILITIVVMQGLFLVVLLVKSFPGESIPAGIPSTPARNPQEPAPPPNTMSPNTVNEVPVENLLKGFKVELELKKLPASKGGTWITIHGSIAGKPRGIEESFLVIMLSPADKEITLHGFNSRDLSRNSFKTQMPALTMNISHKEILMGNWIFPCGEFKFFARSEFDGKESQRTTLKL